MKRIMIEGMGCQNCVHHVTAALEALDGVNDVNVSLSENCATVDTMVEDSILKDAVEDAGYDVTEIVKI